jgi:hypothetical protein
VDDHGQVVDVNAASRYVRRDQYLNLTGLYRTQSALALGLAAVTVQGHCGKSAFTELLGQTIGPVLSAGEDNGLAVLFDYFGAEVGLLVARYAPEEVVNVTGGLFAHDVVSNGVFSEFLDEGANIGPHRGGEQHHVTLLSGGAHDATNCGHKAHVGHAVGLVDGDGGALAQVKSTLVEHVLETPGAGDNDVDAGGQSLASGVVAGATVDRQDATTLVLGELSEFFLDLSGQFARRYQDQSVGLARTGNLGAGEKG